MCNELDNEASICSDGTVRDLQFYTLPPAGFVCSRSRSEGVIIIDEIFNQLPAWSLIGYNAQVVNQVVP